MLCPVNISLSVSIPPPPLRKTLMLLENITVDYSPPSGAHGSVVIGINPKTKRSLVQTLQWSPDVVYYTLRKGTLSTLSRSTNMKLGTGLCWELTWDGLVFHPGVNGSHPFSTIDTWDKYWPFAASLHGEGFFVLLPTAYRYCYRPPVQ